MYTLHLAELKKLDANGLRVQLDKAISAMLYPNDDPAFVWPEGNQPDRLQILDESNALRAGEVVALRYIWFLYKKATIPGYKGGESPAWYEAPAARG